MKWIPRAEVLFTRAAGFPDAEYDDRLPWHFWMPGRPSWKRLLEATTVIAETANARSLILCPRAQIGWVNVPKRKERSAVEIPSPPEALEFIRNHSHYRSQLFADYYLTDRSFSWLTKFTHHDDWHAFLPERIACSVPLKRAFFTLRFRSMPPWPLAEADE